MRQIKLLGSLMAALFLLMLLGCTSGPTEPEEVLKAKQSLDEAWKNAAVHRTFLECAAHTPGLAYVNEKIETLLGSASASQRQQGVELLAEWADPSDAERLATFLSDESPLVALQAAKGLAALGDNRGQDILEGKIRTNDELLNAEICELLAKIGSDACVAPARKELTSEDKDKSAAASVVLGDLATPEAIETLRSGLGSVHGEQRAPIILALGFASDDPKDAVRVARYLRYTENVLASLGALGEIGGDEAKKKLREILGKDDRRASLAAAGSLARLGDFDEEIAAKFEAALEDESETLRFEAASYLAEAETSPEILALLAKAVEDESPKVVRAALDGLRGSATAELLPSLQIAWGRFNASTEPDIYDAALQTIVVASKIEGPEADAFLQSIMGHSNWGHDIQASLAVLARWEASQAPAAG